MKPLKIRLSITVDPAVANEIRVLAEEADRTISSYLNVVLKEHIKKARSHEKDADCNRS